MLLSLAGGVLGLIFGVVGIRALLAVNTAGLPRVGENGALVGLDWRVLLSRSSSRSAPASCSA